jgi:hypothetical protein
MFAAWMGQNLDGAELPPSSLLLTDALWVSLAAFGITLLVRRRRWSDAEYTVGLAAFSLSIPAALMLTHIYMAMRYRAEFQPALMLLAIYGLMHLEPFLVDHASMLRKAMLCAAVCSILFSQMIAVTSWPYGPTHNMNLPKLYSSQYEWATTKLQRAIYRIRGLQ